MIKKIISAKLVLIFILIACIYRIYLDYAALDKKYFFGYMDYQHYWNSWTSLANGGVLYKNFFWEYGILYLLIGLPFFILLGKSFFACIFTMLIIMPLIGLIFSLAVGKQALSRFWLTLFIVLLMVHGVNTYLVSIRHFLPELGIVFFMLGCELSQKYKIFLGSLVLGISMFSGVEYGLAALITIGFYLIIKSIFYRFSDIKAALLGVGIVIVFLLANIIMLQKQQALSNYVQFFKEYISSFNYLSPCREVFPRFTRFTNRRLLIDNLVSLDLYIIPLSILILFFGFLSKIKSNKIIPFILALLVYSAGVFFRAISTPCFGYVSYGLTLYFLALILVMKLFSRSKLSNFVCILLMWFLITGTGKFLQILNDLPQLTKNINQKILPVAEIKLESDLVDSYQEITDYIKNNSSVNDYLYVYPNGPYNQLTGRKSPVSISSSWYYALAPFLEKITLNELQAKEPEYVIMNVYNGFNIISALNNYGYDLYQKDKSLIIDGVVTTIEEYLSQNYEIVKKNKVAWILKRADSKSITKKYLPEYVGWNFETSGLSLIENDAATTIHKYLINQKMPFILLSSENISKFALIKIPIKVNLGILRPVSKFTIDVFSVNGNNIIPLTRQFASSDWQDVWLYPYRSKINQTKKIMVIISNNYGLLPFGKPFDISIKNPQGFILNSNIDYSSAAFKVK
jgi:hypothetical protein